MLDVRRTENQIAVNADQLCRAEEFLAYPILAEWILQDYVVEPVRAEGITNGYKVRAVPVSGELNAIS